jgi:hypothetical protein
VHVKTVEKSNNASENLVEVDVENVCVAEKVLQLKSQLNNLRAPATWYSLDSGQRYPNVTARPTEGKREAASNVMGAESKTSLSI